MTHTKLAAVVAAAALLAGGVAALPGSGASTKSLVGTWQRTNSCTAFVKAMRRAGISRKVMREWLIGAGYFRSARVIARIDSARPCKGARNVKHSHFFTRAGGFGSYDENGGQVDDGNYKIVAPHTLVFPSHATEFGHKIKVHYRIRAGKLRFSVVVPHPCASKCQNVLGWALSAFYPGPAFTRGR
jgi:hypothetical protein